ncbi:hypothetical protein LK08_16350 [Streptomyces sp. MUSC 125]|nr:hypothetical protein LK08_16350 [Streptomyces sp. MUSC 125]
MGRADVTESFEVRPAPKRCLVQSRVVVDATAVAPRAAPRLGTTRFAVLGAPSHTLRPAPWPYGRLLDAANYRAFRNRRSLLLLDLQRQLRAEELPWVRAVAAQRVDDGTDVAATALPRLGGLAVRAFPGTILPNPLIRELSVLARQAELGAPFVEELAADIFMGTFTPKFLTTALSEESARQPWHVVGRLDPALTGLRRVMDAPHPTRVRVAACWAGAPAATGCGRTRYRPGRVWSNERVE